MNAFYRLNHIVFCIYTCTCCDSSAISIYGSCRNGEHRPALLRSVGALYTQMFCLTFALVANWLDTTPSHTAQNVLLSLCHLGRIEETDGHTLRGTYSIERIHISVHARRVLFALSWDAFTVPQSSSTLMVCCAATDLCLENIIFKLIICVVHPLLQ